MKTNTWLPVFKNNEHNVTLEKEGIVKFSLGAEFDPKICDQLLKDCVAGYPKTFQSNFYSSVALPDLNLKKKVHNGLDKIISPILNDLLVDHKPLIYFFLVKGTGKESELKLHQDWTIVDERSFRAYSLWIPLSTSVPENGTVHVLKRSHLFPLNIRGAGIPPKFSSCDSALKYMEPVTVNPGEALIFDCRLLHYSPPNTTGTSRTAIINNIIPKKATTMRFLGETLNDKLVVTEEVVPENFFINYEDFVIQKDNPGQKNSLKEISYSNTDKVTENEFNALIKTYVAKKRWYFF